MKDNDTLIVGLLIVLFFASLTYLGSSCMKYDDISKKRYIENGYTIKNIQGYGLQWTKD